VLAPLLFNSYANDQSKPKGAERFIYADLCLATQSHDFSEIESTLSRYVELVHYDANHFRANPIKTELCAFHLRSRDTWRMLSIQWENAHVQGRIKRGAIAPGPPLQGVPRDDIYLF